MTIRFGRKHSHDGRSSYGAPLACGWRLYCARKGGASNNIQNELCLISSSIYRFARAANVSEKNLRVAIVRVQPLEGGRASTEVPSTHSIYQNNFWGLSDAFCHRKPGNWHNGPVAQSVRARVLCDQGRKPVVVGSSPSWSAVNTMHGCTPKYIRFFCLHHCCSASLISAPQYFICLPQRSFIFSSPVYAVVSTSCVNITLHSWQRNPARDARIGESAYHHEVCCSACEHVGLLVCARVARQGYGTPLPAAFPRPLAAESF